MSVFYGPVQTVGDFLLRQIYRPVNGIGRILPGLKGGTNVGKAALQKVVAACSFAVFFAANDAGNTRRVR